MSRQSGLQSAATGKYQAPFPQGMNLSLGQMTIPGMTSIPKPSKARMFFAARGGERLSFISIG